MNKLSILLVLGLALLAAGCNQEPTVAPEASEAETSQVPAAGEPEQGEASTTTDPAEPGAATPGATIGSSEPPAETPSTAEKTGATVGGALNTAGEATKKGVKTGIGAVVKGAKKVGGAAEDAGKGVASGVKGAEKKEQ